MTTTLGHLICNMTRHIFVVRVARTHNTQNNNTPFVEMLLKFIYELPSIMTKIKEESAEKTK